MHRAVGVQLLGANLNSLESLQGLTHVCMQPSSSAPSGVSVVAFFPNAGTMQRALWASPGMHAWRTARAGADADALSSAAAAARSAVVGCVGRTHGHVTGPAGDVLNDSMTGMKTGMRPRRASGGGGAAAIPGSGGASNAAPSDFEQALLPELPTQLASSHCMLGLPVRTRLVLHTCRAGCPGEAQLRWQERLAGLNLSGLGTRRAVGALVAQQVCVLVSACMRHSQLPPCTRACVLVTAVRVAAWPHRCGG